MRRVTFNLPDRFTLGLPSRHFLLQAGDLASGVAPAEYPFQPASAAGSPCYSSSVGQRSALWGKCIIPAIHLPGIPLTWRP